MSTIESSNKNTSGSDPLDALNQIEANLDREEIEWEPEEVGERVIGYVTGIEYIDTKDGNRIGVLLIDTKNGTRVRVWAGRTRLRKQLVRAKVQPGDAIGIRYEGKKEAKNGGNDYFDYKVDVIREGPRRDGEMFTEEEDLGLVAGAVDDMWTGEAASAQEAGF